MVQNASRGQVSHAIMQSRKVPASDVRMDVFSIGEVSFHEITCVGRAHAYVSDCRTGRETDQGLRNADRGRNLRRSLSHRLYAKYIRYLIAVRYRVLNSLYGQLSLATKRSVFSCGLTFTGD